MSRPFNFRLIEAFCSVMLCGTTIVAAAGCDHDIPTTTSRRSLVAYPRHVATSALTSVFIGLLAEHFNLKPVRDANIGAPAQSLASGDFVLTSIG